MSDQEMFDLLHPHFKHQTFNLNYDEDKYMLKESEFLVRQAMAQN